MPFAVAAHLHAPLHAQEARERLDARGDAARRRGARPRARPARSCGCARPSRPTSPCPAAPRAARPRRNRPGSRRRRSTPARDRSAPRSSSSRAPARGRSPPRRRWPPRRPLAGTMRTRWWNCVSMAARSGKMSAWSNSRLLSTAVRGRYQTNFERLSKNAVSYSSASITKNGESVSERGDVEVPRHAADEEAGVEARVGEDPGEHRRRRGLAVRSRHREHPLAGQHVLGEPLRPGDVGRARG